MNEMMLEKCLFHMESKLCNLQVKNAFLLGVRIEALQLGFLRGSKVKGINEGENGINQLKNEKNQ